MNRWTSLLLMVLAISVSSAANGQAYNVLFSFSGTGGAYPGKWPAGDLTLSGSTLYGMTPDGGASNCGTIFNIKTTGSGFQSLFSFSGTDGNVPSGDLTLSGSTLYGTAGGGGTDGYGTIFNISTTGGSLHTVLSFSGGNGQSPMGSLTLSGSTLYGMTSGAPNGNGTIFSVNTDGSGFQSLLSFSGTDGKNPMGNVTLSSSTLYGMTSEGGAKGDGNIFSVKTDGSGFQNLVSFTGISGANPGEFPAGSLTLSGSTLYGMTGWGGANNDGTVFSISTTGGSLHNLLSFTGSSGAYLGATPLGNLTLIGSTLYGMTTAGGAYGNGAIFSINTDGSDFQTLLSFTGTGGTYAGATPCGGLTLRGSILYGMTEEGGANNIGVVFSLAIPATLTWTRTGSGSWNSASNWDGNRMPGNNPHDTANFGTVIGSNTATVTLDGSWTIGCLAFNTTGGGSYTISRTAGDSTSTLTLTSSGVSFPLTNSGGSHTVAVPVILGSNLAVSATTGSSLTVSGPISETSPGRGVTIAGGGILILSGSNSYTGGTTVSGGTLDFSTPNATPSTGIVTATTGGYVALGALSAPRRPRPTRPRP